MRIFNFYLVRFTFYFIFSAPISFSLCLVTQLCPILWGPMDCSLPGSSVLGDSPGKNIGVGFHALLQVIFPTQGSNPGLPNCRWIVYYLSHQGSPRILEWVAYLPNSLSVLQGIFLTQELNWGLLHCRRILYQLSYQGMFSNFSISSFSKIFFLKPLLSMVEKTFYTNI